MAGYTSAKSTKDNFCNTQAVQQASQQALVEAEATLRGDDCEEKLMESAALESDERDLVEEEDEAFTRNVVDQDFFT